MFDSNFKPVKSLGKYITQRDLSKVFHQIIEQNKLHERGERSSNWKMDVVEVTRNRFSIVLYAVCEFGVVNGWPEAWYKNRSFTIPCAYSMPKKSYNAAYQAMCKL